MKTERHFYSNISLFVGNVLPLFIYPVLYEAIFMSVCFSYAALPFSFLLLYVFPPLCFTPSYPSLLISTSPPRSILTLICHSESWGGSVLRSDSYKILIGTRNMIVREKGGWNRKKGRDGNTFFLVKKPLAQKLFPPLRHPCRSSPSSLNVFTPSSWSVSLPLASSPLHPPPALFWSPDRVNYWH